MNYFSEAIIATSLTAFAWLSIGFFHKNYQIGGGIMLVWYALGMFIGGIAVLRMLGFTDTFADMIPNKGIVFIILLGATIGALANILSFTAVSSAPNEGEPIAILATSSVFVSLLSYGLARFFPRYFDKPDFNIWSVLGILLVLTGVIIIALRNRL